MVVELQEPRISVVCNFAFPEGRKLPGFEDRKVPDLKKKNKTPASCEDSCAPAPVSAITRVVMTTGKEVDTFIFWLEKALESISQNYFNKIITISCCHKYRAATDFKMVMGVNAFCRTVIWASMQAGEHKEKKGGQGEGRRRTRKKAMTSTA